MNEVLSMTNSSNENVALPDSNLKWAKARLHLALKTLTALIFLLMCLGATVRNMGAGLSCPDWPLCYGKLIPPMDPQVFSEWFHRLIASFVSLGTILVTVMIWKNPVFRRTLGKLNIIAVLLLGLQVVLGGLTVIGLLKSEIVTSHLGTAFLFFGVTLWMTLKAGDFREGVAPQVKPALKKFSRGSFVAAGVVYLQVLLGGSVASNYAGLACADFPTCNGQWWPALGGNVTIQFLHRIGALLVFLKVLSIAGRSLKVSLSPKARRLVALAVFFLILQISLGIGSVLMRLPLWMSVSHLAVAVALFSTLLALSYHTLEGDIDKS